MSKNVVVNGTTYNGVDSVKLSLVGGGYATFADAESGTSQTDELYSVVVSEAANKITIPWNSAWNSYSVIFVAVENFTMSETDWCYVSINNQSFNSNGFYINGSTKFSSLESFMGLLLVKYNNVFRYTDSTNAHRTTEISPSNITVFTTTASVNITGGTIKVIGVK